MSSTVDSPPEGYHGEPLPSRPRQAPMSTAAIVGFVGSLIFWPVGFVASVIALGKTRAGGLRGRGLAIAGLIISILAAIAWVAIVTIAVTIGGSAVKAASDTAKAPAAQAAAPAPSTSVADGTTAGQRQALRSAKEYLSMQAFSHDGLIDQLSSDAGDGFSVADATYAADHCGADWNEEAAKAAKDYLSMQGYSHSELVEQLDSSAGDKFTPAQAEYGVRQAGL